MEKSFAMDKIFNTDSQEMSLVSRLLYQFIEEKYRPLLDESSDLMCITDREGKFIYVNRKLADSLGYTKKELLGMHLRDIVADDSMKAFQESVKDFLKNGKITFRSFVLKTRYKGAVTGEMHSMAFHDNGGKYCGAKAVFRDQTQLRAMELLERKYESMLEDGIGAVDSVIFILDPAFKIRWATATVEKYFGLDRTVVVGEDIRELFRHKVAPLVSDGDSFLKKLLKSCEEAVDTQSFECEFLGPKKNVGIAMEHRSFPILHGDLKGGRIQVFRDITQRKKAEETLEYYYKKIHAIMEHAVEGIVELRTDNTIGFVNKSFLRMMGRDEMQMLNRELSEFIVSGDLPKLASIKLIRKACEIAFVRSDGTLLHALVSSIPLVFGSQAPHALCFISDITETKMAAEKLRDANLTLRALNNTLLDLSLRDTRTGVYNYRYLHERLAEEVKRAKRYMRPFSLILMDIDFFKAVNDSYGHSFGDVVLKEFCELLKKTVRETDIVIRSGGEEFVVLLSDTDGFGAWTAAHKIVKALEATPIGDENRKVIISVSIGICSYPDSGRSEVAALIDAADESMYQSKKEGRNRITVFQKGAFAREGRSGPQASLEELRDRLENISARNEASLLEVLLSAVRDVDQRMGYPAGHIDRVLSGVERLAQAFSFPDPEVRKIRRAALACDVGMVSVPQELLSWPGPLVEDQRRLIHQHCVHSADAIRSLPFLAAARGDILSHHERFDGKGYPEGLRGPQIPFGARIIPVVETYEALTSARPYRKQPYSKAESLEIIRRESSRQFDPLVVEQFLKICG